MMMQAQKPPTGVGINGGQVLNDNGQQAQVSDVLTGEAESRRLEQSFKQFCETPERQAQLMKHQESEFRRARRLNRKMKAIEFKEKVLDADYEAQKNVAPFLENRVLRRIVNTFCNDQRNDFSKWATNPLVIRMLTNAKKQMDEGRMTEEEAEFIIGNMLSDPENPAYHEVRHKTRQVVRLGTEQLVHPLNEQLEHRRRGNDLYKAKKFNEALAYYNKALSVCNFVVGMSSADQREIDTNKVMILMNICAVEIALKNYGAAIKKANEALELDPRSIKILLRRAKAYIGRREYELAQADLDAVKEREPWNWEAEEELRRMKRIQRRDYENDKGMAANVFSPQQQ